MGGFIRFLLIVVVLAVLGVMGYVWLQLGPIVKTQVENYGTKATGTSVKLDNVGIAFMKGGLALNGLSVGNPEGYSGGSALSVGTVSVTVDPKSLFDTGPILVKEIVIDKPAISYEGSLTGSNLASIQKNIRDYANALGGGAGGSGQGQGRKLIIENLHIRHGHVSISHTSIGDKKLEAKLPDITRRNVGLKTGGATYAEVAQQVLGAVLRSSSQVAVEKIAGETGGPLGAAGAAVGNMIGNIFGDGEEE